MRAQTGAFSKNTIGSRLSGLAVTAENLSMARSSILDTDFASEIVALNSARTLFAAGIASAKVAIETSGMLMDVLG